MNIEIKNCKNVDYGVICIDEKKLNIKYAINGTGKSTIVKAIKAQISDDSETELKKLLPYKYKAMDNNINISSVTGVDSIHKICVFDEDFVEKVVFKESELIQNSFEIFVETDDYDQHLSNINRHLARIRETFTNHEELNNLIGVLENFCRSFGGSSEKIALNSVLARGFSKGNCIKHIPRGLEEYSTYLQVSDNGKNWQWLGWQLSGKDYLLLDDNKCPYCAQALGQRRDSIELIERSYEKNQVKHLNEVIQIFTDVTEYLSDNTCAKINAIKSSSVSLNENDKDYLQEIREQALKLLDRLLKLREIRFSDIRRDVVNLADQIEGYKIELNVYSHFCSTLTTQKISELNVTIDQVLNDVNNLKAEVGRQNFLIRSTIASRKKEINDFLAQAGYSYEIDIIEDDQHEYRVVLMPKGIATTVVGRSELSYGERNALALAMFMYSSLREEPDLIVLDDPISSFDGNKRFALINLMFGEVINLSNKTVLLLTHDLQTIVELVYIRSRMFGARCNATFVSNCKGQLKEKVIRKENLKLWNAITKKYIDEEGEDIVKCVYLRRLYEVEGRKDSLEWNLLSNILKRRPVPIKKIDSEHELSMTEEEIVAAVNKIRENIPNFDYSNLLGILTNQYLVNLYRSRTSNYEKLQVYRVLCEKNNNESFIRKFVNEVFHVENDSLMQLDPREYDTVPQYIIDVCDEYVDAVHVL